jgi:endonuclease III related protein
MTSRQQHPSPPPPPAGEDPLLDVYRRLRAHFGYLHWWPGESPFEVMIGAILTQNTAWTNVERAIDNLKKAGVLAPHALYALPEEHLAELIRPSGYFNVKARRLRAFLRWLVEDFGGEVDKLAAVPTERLRLLLLSVSGIGPETADSILLYACERPIFVVDAYTRRTFARLDFTAPDADYDTLQRFFTARLPATEWLYNDYHAQIVYLGKDFCRPRPRCRECPLGAICPTCAKESDN